MVFLWSLRDSKFTQVSSTLLSILANLNNAVVAVRVFANGPGDLGSIPGRVIPKTQKMVLLLNTQLYKVWIKGKVEQSRERVAPSPTPIEKGAFGLPSTMVANFILLTGWSPLVLLFLSLPVPLPIFGRLFQAHKLQLVSPPPSCSIAF